MGFVTLFYDREGKPLQLLEWARMFETIDRTVMRTTERRFMLSTVWLGNDMNWSPQGPPLIFESCVFFPDGSSEVLDRYPTEADALDGHQRHLRELQERRIPWRRRVPRIRLMASMSWLSRRVRGE